MFTEQNCVVQTFKKLKPEISLSCVIYSCTSYLEQKNLIQSNHQIVTLLFGVHIICVYHIQTSKRVKEYNTELPFEKGDTNSNRFKKKWD